MRRTTTVLAVAGASAAIWRASRFLEGEISWTMPAVAGAILLSAFVVQSILGLQNA